MHRHQAMIIERARACIGTRTRAQGRSIGHALDCVGVVLEAAKGAQVSAAVPEDYAIGADNGDLLCRWLIAAGCRRVTAAEPGDIAELEVAPRRQHLAVCCGTRFVHAHFGVRRVVEAPLPGSWRVVAAWRLPEIN